MGTDVERIDAIEGVAVMIFEKGHRENNIPLRGRICGITP